MPPSRHLLLLGPLLLVACRETWAPVLGVREISPEEVATTQPIVVDLRDPVDFSAGHVAGALNVPPGELDGWLARSGPPRSTPLVTTCATGPLALQGAATVAGWGWLDVRAMDGGMAAWVEQGLPVVSGAEPAPTGGPPLREVTTFTQWVTVITAFGVKPAYMALSLFLLFLLRGPQPRDLLLLRYAILAFFAGEAFCAANYLVSAMGSDGLEIAHLTGMVLFGALLPWALFTLGDRRVLHLTDASAPCVGIRLCGRCWKKQEVACGLHRLMLWALPALALLALIPFCLAIEPYRATIPILGTDVPYGHSLAQQLVEFRLFPLLALGAFAAAFAQLLRGRKGLHPSEPFFFLGQGLLTFSLLRFFFRFAWRPAPPWSDAWEELTELLTILALLVLLHTFRRPLGLMRFLDHGKA